MYHALQHLYTYSPTSPTPAPFSEVPPREPPLTEWGGGGVICCYWGVGGVKSFWPFSVADNDFESRRRRHTALRSTNGMSVNNGDETASSPVVIELTERLTFCDNIRLSPLPSKAFSMLAHRLSLLISLALARPRSCPAVGTKS